MTEVGFEPTPPKRLVPKTSALDHSANQSCMIGNLLKFSIMFSTSKKLNLIQNAICVQRVHSSVVEHGIADPAVTGSNPVVPFPGWCSW